MSAKTNPLLQSLLAQSRRCRRDERHNPRCKRCARGRGYAGRTRGVS
ncbi:hypothetical protein SEA_DOGGS_45 [Gordonia phage Doggs]|nr:hypothetical protein SEA_DOGGS_45 [Gordonia phage Doggs]